MRWRRSTGTLLGRVGRPGADGVPFFALVPVFGFDAEEGSQRRQGGERRQPQPLQERRRRREQDRPPGRFFPSRLLDEPLVLESPEDAVGVDTPDRGDLVPGYRLFVRDDRKRL